MSGFAEVIAQQTVLHTIVARIGAVSSAARSRRQFKRCGVLLGCNRGENGDQNSSLSSPTAARTSLCSGNLS
ncbi:MAG: hypothetical protein EAZ30_00275 [Betaproteobacteria bacterium]|nr:MAG: hypothetical protein EAZ30_00275 [Betaproteobacteria bacterium]